jgi:hypothetical protein
MLDMGEEEEEEFGIVTRCKPSVVSLAKVRHRGRFGYSSLDWF